MKPTNRLFYIMPFLLATIMCSSLRCQLSDNNSLTTKVVYNNWKRNSGQFNENNNHPKNYINSYSTTSQNISVPNTFQNILFDKDGSYNGWIRTNGNFKVPQTGYYLVTYSLTIGFTSSSKISEQLLSQLALDGQEIVESRSLYQVTFNQSNITTFPMGQTFILHAKKNQIVNIQFKTNNSSIATVSAITIPSAFITITPIKS